MKKSLLFCLAVTACNSLAMAQTKTPTIYPELAFQRITADSHYAVSEVYGTLTIVDLKDGSIAEEFIAQEDWGIYYSIGNGNCWTSDGSILVGSTTYFGNAAYFENGEWEFLSVPDEDKTNIANAITPDGSRICGSVGLHDMTLDDIMMQMPVYWDRNENGDGYGEYHILPHPTKDLFGENPQYVMAISISSDGKTILGQMVFGNGAITIPVLFAEDEKGEWSYSLPTKELFNPFGLEPVENPGDGPEPPQYEDFMTEEELSAYEEAVNDYFNAEPGTMGWPSYEDYMSEDSLNAFLAAQEKYQEEYDIWRAKYDEYDEYITGVTDSSARFLQNNVFFSTDEKYIVSTIEMDDPNADPWSWFHTSIYRPATVNIETGEFEMVDTELSLLVSGVADNGTILAYNGQRSIPMLGYIIKDGNIQEIGEYINSKVPSYGEWINRNMTHEVVVDYDDEWNEIYEEVTFTGMPVATPDMSVITIWNNTPWDYMSNAEGVVFDMSQTSGIAAIAAAKKNLSFANGELNIPAGFASVEIFNLGGACVKTVNGVEGSVKLNLANGAYIAKGTRVDGSVSVIKLAK